MTSEVLGVDIGLLTAAHELKSPLSLLRQLALSYDLAADPSKVTDQMVSISEHALSQIDDLLSVARLENGLFDLEPVNPRSICDDVMSSRLYHLSKVQGEAEEQSEMYSGIHRASTGGFNEEICQVIKPFYRNRSRLVIANHNLLRSIVDNFLTNAIKYGDTTRLTIADHAGVVRISVRDFGPALPTSIWRTINANKLNSPIHTPLRPGSSGLGLFIASRFARHMNARLGATRHRDGTSFYLDLPVSGQLCLC